MFIIIISIAQPLYIDIVFAVYVLTLCWFPQVSGYIPALQLTQFPFNFILGILLLILIRGTPPRKHAQSGTMITHITDERTWKRYALSSNVRLLITVL